MICDLIRIILKTKALRFAIYLAGAVIQSLFNVPHQLAICPLPFERVCQQFYQCLFHSHLLYNILILLLLVVISDIPDELYINLHLCYFAKPLPRYVDF